MNAETPAMEVRNLYKQFQIGKRGIFSKEEFVRAVDGVSLSIRQGETLALVGESGCGKSTLALTLMGLEKPTQGSILFEGKDPVTDKEYHFKEWCRNIQMVFQDPYESLNPLMTIGDTVAEPLQVHGITKNQPERDERVIRALEDAGLKPAVNFLNRLPHELSGGQRQRVVIAGALVLEPRVILADEPVSMLDVSIRAEILNLLKDLSRDKGISILYITHDLGTAAYFADRIAVMYLGRIVELGAMLDVLNNPKHPYTQALLSVVPVPNPRLRRKRIILAGDPPNAVKIPTGCRFHPRCPIAVQRCKEIDPQLVELGGHHGAACLLLN